MPVLEFTVKQEELLLFKKRRHVRQLTSNAVARGDLYKPLSCELCNERCKVEAHHVDYGKPLQVIWLCKKCHVTVHKKDHHLNPKNNVQSPMPAILDKYTTVHVAFTLSVDNFLALQAEAEKQGRPIASLMREQVQNDYPVRKNQLEFKFEENKDGDTQSILHEGIQSVAEDEGVLLQQESPCIQKVRRKRHLNLSRVERDVYAIPSGYGSNAGGLQRACAH